MDFIDAELVSKIYVEISTAVSAGPVYKMPQRDLPPFAMIQQCRHCDS
jgi:hypothetical protein